MKKCPKCKKEKPLSEFYKNKNKKSGLTSYCKPCSNKLTSGWHNKNLGKRRKAYKKYYAKNKKRKKNYHLKIKYGISLEDYETILNEQEGCCKICNKHYTKCRRALLVDHNHKTGEVRGLLCDDCNLALGLFKEDSKIILKASKYLD